MSERLPSLAESRPAGAKPRDWDLAWAVGAVVVLGLLVLYFWPWTSDDAFISFRYSEKLAHGQGLVFNPGERVEGYSNFLFVLLLSVASLLSTDIVVAAKLLGVAGLVVVVLLVSGLSVRLSGRRQSRMVALLLCGTAVPLAYWSVSGLETVAYAALVLLASRQYLAYLEDGTPSSPAAVAFLAVALMRAEGIVFFLLTCVFHLASGLARSRRWRPSRGDIAAVAIVLLPYMGFLAFRYFYYGSLIPNTVVAKTGHDRQLSDGVIYLVEFLPVAATLLFLGLRPYFVGKPHWRPAEAYLWWLCGWWAVMVVWFGGDWMLLYRFFLPILPLLYLLASVGFARMWAHAAELGDRGLGKRRALSMVLGCGLLLNSALPLWSVRPEVMEGYISWDGAVRDAALWLATNARKEERIALFDAGRIPFYSGLRIIDCAGLLDPSIARLPGRFEFKQGVSAYVLGLRPEYIELNAYGVVRENRFVSAEWQDFFQEPGFLDGYRLVFYRDAWRNNPGHRFILIYQRNPG